jgi:hypothetical protein
VGFLIECDPPINSKTCARVREVFLPPCRFYAFYESGTRANFSFGFKLVALHFTGSEPTEHLSALGAAGLPVGAEALLSLSDKRGSFTRFFSRTRISMMSNALLATGIAVLWDVPASVRLDELAS